MAALLIKNGRVIDPASGHDGVADVAIEDGVIAAVGANLSAKHGVEVFEIGRASCRERVFALV